MKKGRLLAGFLFAAPILLAAGAPDPSPQNRPPALRDVGLDQRIGERIPLDLPFRDESGRTVALSEYFGSKAVILTLNYYECPMLCTLELKGLTAALKTMSLQPDRDFRIVTVSINPKETPALAAGKKAVHVRDYGRPGAQAGWHFLTGEPGSIRRLAEAVGFRYSLDEETGQYAHAAGIMVLTPDGRLSRYFYGVEFSPRDLRWGLVESSMGRIGSVVDQVLLFCYHYDPATGRYGMAALSTMRWAGAATALALAAGVALALRREKRRSVSEPESTRAI
jgi:protein SCO1/2